MNCSAYTNVDADVETGMGTDNNGGYTRESDDLGCGFDEDNLEEPMSEKTDKSRERNREHARRTRLRKKAYLENMKFKLRDLQQEANKLTRQLEECNTANILLCMSSKSSLKRLDSSERHISEELLDGNLLDSIKSKVRGEASQQDKLDQLKLEFAGGVAPSPSTDAENDDDCYIGLDISGTDDKGDLDITGRRKERNRMHAKQTRDRKKLFMSKVQQTIAALERQNTYMKNRIKALEQSQALVQAQTQSFSLSGV